MDPNMVKAASPNIVKVSRDALGLSQDEMAELLGVSKNTIYNWEKSKTAPSSAMIDRIHKATMEHHDARQVELGGGPDLCLVIAPNGFFRRPYGKEAAFEIRRETYPAMSAALNRAYWLERAGKLGHAFIVGASERVLVGYEELLSAIEADGPTTFSLSAADERQIPFGGRSVWRVTSPTWDDTLEIAEAMIAEGCVLKIGTPEAVLSHDDIVAALAKR